MSDLTNQNEINNESLSINQTIIVPNNTPENSPPLTNANANANSFFTAHEGGNNSNTHHNNLIKGENKHFYKNAGNFIIQQPNDILNKQRKQQQEQEQKQFHIVTKDLYMNLNPKINFENNKLKMNSSWLQSKKFNNDDNDYSLNENNNNNNQKITDHISSADSTYNSNFLKKNDTLIKIDSKSNIKKNLLDSNSNITSDLQNSPNLNNIRSELNSSDNNINDSDKNNLSQYHNDFITSSIEQSRIPTAKLQSDLNQSIINNETPIKPPKVINSKFDGLRTRLLNNPKVPHSSSRRHSDEEDMMGTAAAVLSNMRSSPFKFKITKDSFPSSSRPHSSSFSARSNNNNSRPRLIVHKMKDLDSKDDSAIGSLSSTEEESTDHEQNSPNGTVNWNKNGKRVSTTHIETTKVKIIKNDSKYQPIASTNTLSYQQKKKGTESNDSKSKINKINDDNDDENRMEPLSEETLKASITGAKNSFRVMSDGKNVKNNNRSTRSRSGCWICRLRKKKCTEEKPSCINCSRLNLTCYYDVKKPDFVSDPIKKAEKLKEIKKFTRAAKRSAMKKKTYIVSNITGESDNNNSSSTINTQ